MDWKQALGAVAPGLATMLGGPLAGMATTAAMGYFGIETTGDAAKDEQALSQKVQSMTPADAIALKAIDADLAKAMKQADVDIYKTTVADRSSARDMRVKLGGDNISAILAVIIVLAWVGIQVIIFTTTTELPNKDLLMRTLGTLDAALLTILYFFYGGSKGSQDKTRIDASKMR